MSFSPAPGKVALRCRIENVGEDVVTQSNILTMPGHEQKPMTIDADHLERMTLGTAVSNGRFWRFSPAKPP